MNKLRLMFLVLLVIGAGSALAEPVKDVQRPVVVGHRGLVRHAPENTLAAFRACLELGIGFELDVRRTRDGKLVCVHDDTVDRTSDGSGKVTELTYEQLRQLDAGGWFDAKFRGQRAPLLSEVFALVANFDVPEAAIAVDLKGADAAIEADVLKLANRHRVTNRLLMIGRAIENPAVRSRLRKADSAAHVARVANRLEEFEQALADRDANWVYVRYVPSPAEVARVHEAGKRVFIAGPTVAGLERENWQRATKAGVDAILTDYPLELARQLR